MTSKVRLSDYARGLSRNLVPNLARFAHPRPVIDPSNLRYNEVLVGVSLFRSTPSANRSMHADPDFEDLDAVRARASKFEEYIKLDLFTEAHSRDSFGYERLSVRVA